MDEDEKEIDLKNTKSNVNKFDFSEPSNRKTLNKSPIYAKRKNNSLIYDNSGLNEDQYYSNTFKNVLINFNTDSSNTNSALSNHDDNNISDDNLSDDSFNYEIKPSNRSISLKTSTSLLFEGFMPPVNDDIISSIWYIFTIPNYEELYRFMIYSYNLYFNTECLIQVLIDFFKNISIYFPFTDDITLKLRILHFIVLFTKISSNSLKNISVMPMFLQFLINETKENKNNFQIIYYINRIKLALIRELYTIDKTNVNNKNYKIKKTNSSDSISINNCNPKPSERSKSNPINDATRCYIKFIHSFDFKDVNNVRFTILILNNEKGDYVYYKSGSYIKKKKRNKNELSYDTCEHEENAIDYLSRSRSRSLVKETYVNDNSDNATSNSKINKSCDIKAMRIPKFLLSKGSKNIMDMDETLVAQSLTIIEWKLFNCIQPIEFFTKGWASKEKEVKKTLSPNIIKYSNRFNKFTYWIMTQIVLEKEIIKRSCRITKFILILKQLEKLNNFNSMAQICHSLNSHVISRLKQTWNLVKDEHKLELKRISRILSHIYNFKKYREELETLFCKHFYQNNWLDIRDNIHLQYYKMTTYTKLQHNPVNSNVKRHKSQPQIYSNIPQSNKQKQPIIVLYLAPFLKDILAASEPYSQIKQTIKTTPTGNISVKQINFNYIESIGVIVDNILKFKLNKLPIKSKNKDIKKFLKNVKSTKSDELIFNLSKSLENNKSLI